MLAANVLYQPLHDRYIPKIENIDNRRLKVGLETIRQLPPQYPRRQHKNCADELKHALHGDAQEAER